mgnify:CR=1 FL=1|tara:strand:- start:1632 stop:2243 length:612 start_codon:yes stop_codon:yes gene_type:complete
MFWEDEGYLLYKSNYSENAIIVEIFTLNHGKCSGIVYGGSSKSKKKIHQIGNKILVNWRSKGENKLGYFNIELLKAISPAFFDDKRKTICILAATSILKLLLPERQINKKIYTSFDKLLYHFNTDEWIKLYILWELSLIKELGYEFDNLDGKISSIISNKNKVNKIHIKKALAFNKDLLMDNLIIPNKLRFPLSRNILEKYFA